MHLLITWPYKTYFHEIPQLLWNWMRAGGKYGLITFVYVVEKQTSLEY